ncbi:telomerase protein component 1-like [Mercenaria mercenaria]|uniref:telomerase protein component 1-like n=1 Tax=Mercenaria mercenaria TaxID=6596 RepID=UPI00234EBE17|nr:telomerase protein component 1-like [Mercenaria mercenaria]
MSGTESSLLAKWTGSHGLSSSLLSSSLVSSNTESSLQRKSDDSQRKRKSEITRTVEKKKTKDVSDKKSTLSGGLLSSGLLQKYGTGSLSGQSAVSMTTRTQGTSFGTSSSLLSGSGLSSSGLLKKSPVEGGSITQSSLSSSLLSKPSRDLSDMLSGKRTRSQVSSGGSSQASHRSELLGSPKLTTVSKKLTGGGSSLTSGSAFLSKAPPTSSLSSTLIETKFKETGGSLSMGLTSGLKSDLLRSTSVTSSKSEEAKPKKGKGEKKMGKGRKRARFDKHAAPPPSYNLSNEISAGREIEMPRFTPPDRDRSLIIAAKIHDVNGLKFALVNAVSGSLICQPDFRLGTDPTRVALVTMAQKVICYDPEFVLKVALYTRKQLNIRTTANFMLALASHMPACRPYLKKYFSASIALPSDWIEVAEIYSAFPEKTLPLGSLPSALRRAMVAKFPDFDKYQLAKYNKESSKKKKKKKLRKAEEAKGGVSTRGGRGRGGRGRGRGAAATRGRDGAAAGRGRGSMLDSDSSSSGSEIDSDEEAETHRQNQAEKGLDSVMFDDGESPEQLQKMSFSIKQLIRKLHITEPVEHVMCLIGKKYPSSLDEFYRSRLPGTYEEERAGKRMKLPVPETWETQVSLKGNKASTWQELLDHKKLPFMAMLRNLRNLIKAGISSKHHTGVIRRLTDERSVINSKQFPFRFFSAYEVLEQLQKDYDASQAAIVDEAVRETSAPRGGATGRGRGRGRGGAGGKTTEKLTAENWWIIKKQRKMDKNKKPKETPFDSNLINRYRKALDTAVKLATVYNVQPIRGRTIILCDVGPNMKIPCTAARGLGKPRTMQEVSVLLGLMCKYSCEDCTMVIFDSSTSMYCTVQLESGTILENMATVLEKDISEDPKARYTKLQADLPMSVLYDNLRDRVQIDNLLLLTGGGDQYAQRYVLNSYLEIYRRLVNPDLLYVNVSFAGRSCGFATDIKPEHDNDIYISGFSDQILRFIAERGEGGQLRHIEKIDEAFNLKPLPSAPGEKPAPPKLDIEKPLQIASQTPSWRTARVFISSTFRDMHGERDLLTRYVFPELRALGKKHFINVYEVDLRWGVTEEETKQSRTLELCLSEVSRCQFFVGILGERYGWVPDKYDVPDTPEFKWVKEYPLGASVTELEIQAAALGHKDKTDMRDKAFFMFRDNSFESDIPKKYREDFECESDRNKEKMDALKRRIRVSGLEVFDNYPCHWGGVVDGKPIVAGLEQFGLRALNNLWNGIQKCYPDEDAMMDETSHANKLHGAFVERLKKVFVGRSKLRKECVKMMSDMSSGVIALAGKPGTGKSALLASLITDYQQASKCDSGLSILTHFVGAAPGSTNIVATLKRLCHELNTRFSLNLEIPEDMKNLVAKFEEMLQESATYCGSPLVVFIDGLDNMEPAHLPHNLDWLPEVVPKNVIFVITCLTQGKFHQSLRRRKVTEVTVEGLDMWDKAEVVKSHLAVHSKALDESPFNNQMKLLVSKKEANVPLYLSLACEELRVYGLFEKMTSKLKALPQTVPTLLQEVMSRMETDLGKDTIATALSLLVCARDGLEQVELHDLLSLFGILGGEKPKVKEIMNMKPSPEECVPSAVFAQLQRALQGFLNDPLDSWSSRLSLSHVDIIQAVRQRYLKSAGAMETELHLHRLIAGYFYSLADPERDGTFSGKSIRAFRELPYHLNKSGSFADLEDVVCNLKFIYNKCMLGLTAELIDDYQPLETSNKTQEREQMKFFEKPAVKEYKSFVSRSLHILSSHPALTWQQAYNENSTSQPARDVQTVLNSDTIPRSQKSLIEWNSKPVNIDPCYLTISNLPEPMTCVSISHDNRQFACGGLDCLVHLYDLSTGKEIRSFRGHADKITDVCFVGSNKLCSVSSDASVSVWDVSEGHRLFSLKGHQRRVNSCSSDKSGNVLATASWDCTIKIWDMKKGSMICEFKVGSPVNCVSFHPEGQKIVSGQWDSTIKIWDIFHKTKKAVLRGHQSSVRDVAYSPSGRHIASAALDGDVKLWAADTGSQVGNIEGHALPINKLTFSPTGKELITVSDDHKVKVWSGHLGKPIITVGTEQLGPAVSIAISPQQDLVAIGYHSGVIKVHDVLSGTELYSSQVHTASVRCLKFMSSAFLLSGSDDCSAKILKVNLRNSCVVTTLTQPVLSADICQNYFAITSVDCTCSVYENPLKYSSNERTILKSVPTRICVMGTHTGPVTSCAFNQNGNRIATGSRDMSVRIWDIIACTFDEQNPTPLHTIHNAHDDWVTDCRWSNTADFIITASSDFNLKVWDVSKIGNVPGETTKESTGDGACKVKYSMKGHMASINHIGYSYGCVVSTCADGSVKMWSHKGVEITTLYGHTQRANGCDISVKLLDESLQDMDGDWGQDEEKPDKMLQPKLDNVMVATCGDDGTARLWYPLQANELSCLTGHSDKVLSVASDNQGRLCTTSLDKSIKLWSCDQESQTVIGGHDAPVTFVCSNFNGDSPVILTGSSYQITNVCLHSFICVSFFRDGVVKLWTSTNSQSKYICVATLKAHTKAVTCGSWLNTSTFVTGSDDEYISTWNLIEINGKLVSARRTNTMKTDSPVLSLNTRNDPTDNYIYTTEWSGAIKVWDTKLIASKQTDYDHSSWLLKIKSDISGRLSVTTMDGNVMLVNLTEVKGKVTVGQTTRVRVQNAESAPTDIPAHKVQPNWITDIVNAGGSNIIVDSRGQVNYTDKHTGSEKSVKVHAAEITCVERDQGFTFTGSKDKTIKIWDKDMNQVGQFFCTSPVTSMMAVGNSTSRQVPIVYGDELGFVNFLTWNCC